MLRLLFLFILTFPYFTAKANDTLGNASQICKDAGLFSTNLITQVCWSCLLPINFFGFGDKPDGAATTTGICDCPDSAGVPQIGYPLGINLPVRLQEVIKQPWCSPVLGGRTLQENYNLGQSRDSTEHDSSEKSFYEYHYWAYPLTYMLELFIIPECNKDPFVDMDLLYLSELDPTYHDDMLALMLAPEAIIFANPLAQLWCAGDCAAVTAGNVSENTFGCAGCDGTLYPLTGNYTANVDHVRGSSLITQRVLASLHRRGLAYKTMGNNQMCEASFHPMIPRSQYKLSMLYPVPEASTNILTPNEQGETDGDGNLIPPSALDPSDKCCHPLGESVHKWATPAGGRHRPGKEDFVYMIWRWTDCCVLW
ncbi:TraU family protein [Motilimonas eburnea]|uniref:TraU family protein n=1 Tax=Motilimonas eburnea TaxID=1737488 RepID=UPI001E2B12F1|nr:TraU family protein [Motilimonas eburnea]MCE2571709.1 TraU family protein [Motilimonas eburnea]